MLVEILFVALLVISNKRCLEKAEWCTVYHILGKTLPIRVFGPRFEAKEVVSELQNHVAKYKWRGEKGRGRSSSMMIGTPKLVCVMD